MSNHLKSISARRSSGRVYGSLLVVLVVAAFAVLAMGQGGGAGAGNSSLLARVTALESAVNALQSSVQNLEGALNAESAARAAGDANLQANLANATGALQASIAQLQAELQNESGQRQANDANFQQQLDARVAQLQAQDAELQNELLQESAARHQGDTNLQDALEELAQKVALAPPTLSGNRTTDASALYVIDRVEFNTAGDYVQIAANGLQYEILRAGYYRVSYKDPSTAVFLIRNTNGVVDQGGDSLGARFDRVLYCEAGDTLRIVMSNEAFVPNDILFRLSRLVIQYLGE